MPNTVTERDSDGHTRYEKGWLANAIRKIKLDLTRRARKDWLESPEWAREQVLQEEKNDAERD